MDVTVGITNRAEQPPRRVHLAVQVGGRTVLACSGGAVRDPRSLQFDRVLAEFGLRTVPEVLEQGDEGECLTGLAADQVALIGECQAPQEPRSASFLPVGRLDCGV